MGSWNKDRATKRINDKISSLPLKDIEIKDYVRDTNLTGIPGTVAYRVDGVHLYADILNLIDMLHVTNVEGETCHKRTLRFLNLHYRAVHRIIGRVDSILVDFHNQRLHSVFAKPYGEEAKRVHRAVATGQLIIDVLARTGEDADHPSANMRIGVDTGKALAVNNGRRGHREPLFLGEPANHAAKRATGGAATGIYLTNSARKVIGLQEVKSEDTTPLTTAEIEASQKAANLDVTVEQIVKEWKEDLEKNPIGSFEFKGHTPPYKTLDIETLSAKNSRRQDATTVYADIDGFTAYVGRNVADDDDAKHVIRALHVLRSELDAVLMEDFGGRKVRFIGDCIHGLLVEGTAQTTDVEGSISNTTLCAGGMRSSFDLAISRLKANGTDATSLGLAIGFEFGPVNVTRLGMKGDLIRCSVSRGVVAAEKEQARCKGTETAIGEIAYDEGTDAVRAIFGDTRVRSKLDYDTAVNEMSSKNDKTARAAKALASGPLLKPATAAATPLSFPDRATGPAKPDGFA
ncbi:transcriptional regulator [Pseudorhodoplanes sinuspersici]|uniref:Transcriptional regulator n=1 Tax=Pseudorhodoplanes sinuspersici TaxID=1235591 RepID=A0A1W6ZQI9_9HYPH|nr:transcriptional regulator [Pseudorhodoplanes sinuspersici]ARP99678.1 transcriptional regulator [Pseudorhodoplanes sinuspersici]RKE70663.1 class 3 adenylate cyclase [Pseudorhodoplanes sinuspersici]